LLGKVWTVIFRTVAHVATGKGKSTTHTTITSTQIARKNVYGMIAKGQIYPEHLNR